MWNCQNPIYRDRGMQCAVILRLVIDILSSICMFGKPGSWCGTGYSMNASCLRRSFIIISFLGGCNENSNFANYSPSVLKLCYPFVLILLYVVHTFWLQELNKAICNCICIVLYLCDIDGYTREDLVYPHLQS